MRDTPPAELGADPEVRLTGLMFTKVFSADPVGAWRAPGALMLLGSATAGLTVALPWGAIVAASPAPEPVLAAYSVNHHAQGFEAPLDDLKPDTAPRWVAPCVRALAEAGRPGGLRIVVNQELPDETGLLTGSETATALALALRDLYGVRETSAVPDPWHALGAHARPGRAVLSGADRVELLAFDLPAAGLRLLLVDVGADRRTDAPGLGGDVEVAAALLRSGDPARIGPLLTEAHEPGTPALDAALSAAWSAGALGGRAIGACLVVLTPVDAVPSVRSAITDRLTGLTPRPPRFLAAVGAPGAYRAL